MTRLAVPWTTMPLAPNVLVTKGYSRHSVVSYTILMVVACNLLRVVSPEIALLLLQSRPEDSNHHRQLDQ